MVSLHEWKITAEAFSETPLACNESRTICMPLALSCCEEDVASGGRLEGSVAEGSMVEEEDSLLTNEMKS